jgi:AraC-like DNA-binding protein
MIYRGSSGEYLEITNIDASNSTLLEEIPSSSLTIVWFERGENVLEVDAVRHIFEAQQVVCLTEFHRIKVKHIEKARMIRFNRAFYCIIHHDSEVGCKGVLFFGASTLPKFKILEASRDTFETVYKVFCLEMESRDKLQLEMLQMVLKRWLILCTRAYKEQTSTEVLEPAQHDLIRAFNFLVEQHFRTKHTVAAYADLLHKSPKTLANVFAKISDKTPLQFIQERKMLEARRLLRYTDKSVKEIAYEIGFEDIQTFSRFFRNKEGCAPTVYREGTQGKNETDWGNLA